ncbi:uncharacterized protein BDR25DRAFT_113795 [Lindgomyces ingoldianus]|uniref:Uncharacterized protein n=1 Tax=Lindgomyces ingoldianus TaxID=673940 RepID=A0ACB6QB09_9PLEO|nr:uncharacterized protein BDR25DRAFT_113795 [Lindgomyces ingoldianus]KAF2463312.1 hypothetical protein BDR25DRAFT_113795 [Lindgomyces ingoldianus]
MADETLLSDLCSIWCVLSTSSMSSMTFTPCPCPMSLSSISPDPAFIHRLKQTFQFAQPTETFPTLRLTESSNNKKSKYCCPGCAARTCSLPCYKRHQQWAQCTGKRDPTKYVKKSQLATPAGIDHDYNFITGIERGLDRKEKDIQDRGLSVANAARTGPGKGEITEQRYKAAGVNVIRAPKGLSRQKENKTHASSKKNIVWTVEWIREGKARLLSETSEVLSLAAAYANLAGQKPNKKRKLEPDLDKNTELERSQDTRGISKDKSGPPQIKVEDEEVERPTPRRSSSEELSQIKIEEASGPDAEVAHHLHTNPDIDDTDSQSLHHRHNFFLLKPRTNSTSHVLIPLSASATLRDCLQGRTVLEFPTLYVLSSAPDSLPNGYLLEEEYNKQERKERKELEETLKAHPEALRACKHENTEENADDAVDNQKILDVLKKDLGTGI